jgi:hypothetical protein
MTFSKTEREVEAEGGRPRSLADLGDLVDAYCGICTQEIEEAHKRHDEEVDAFGDELGRSGM